MSVYTFTGTDSYSEADVKAVMQNTYEDIIGFANREVIPYDRAKRWIEDLTYVLNQKVVKFFEIQLYNTSGQKFMSYRYTVDNNGYLSTGSSSGGIDYYDIPKDCSARLFVDIDYTKPNISAVEAELKKRNWGIGEAMEGSQTHERNYVSNDLRLQRSVIKK